MSTTSSSPVIRYRTLGGAQVHVTAAPNGHVWECQGCGRAETFPQPLPTMRQEANGHAHLCRALPKTTA